jgi:uncharacterized SAM-binding protein YcdF (DUF218 family)
MSGFLPASILPQPSRKRLPFWISGFGVILFLLAVAFLNVGRWLVVNDPLRKATAIAVLSGGMPARALEAARVYKQGYASRVWLTHSTEPGDTLAKLSIPYAAEDEYDRQILIHEGVPEDAIEVLEPPIVNTADEMRTIGAALRTETDRAVIIVTSPVHTRRTKALWKKVANGNGVALLHAATNDTYDPVHWWRTTRDALDVVREVLGLANVWAGLPLRPAQ